MNLIFVNVVQTALILSKSSVCSSGKESSQANAKNIFFRPASIFSSVVRTSLGPHCFKCSVVSAQFRLLSSFISQVVNDIFSLVIYFTES